MEIKTQKTIPLINLSNDKSEIKTLKIIEIKNENKTKFIELFDNFNIKKSDLEVLTNTEKIALNNYLSKATTSSSIVVPKTYIIKKRSDVMKTTTKKEINKSFEMDKEILYSDKYETPQKVLNPVENDKFSISFDNTFLNNISNENRESKIFLVGKLAFETFLDQNNLEYIFDENSIFILKDSGIKIKISTKIWDSPETNPKSRLPYLSLYENDTLKDYDYRIQLLAISENKTFDNIKKIKLLGYSTKEEIIKFYNDFKPTEYYKFPGLRSQQLRPVRDIFKINFQRNKIEAINSKIGNNNLFEVGNQSKVKIRKKDSDVLSVIIGEDYIKKAKEFSRALVEKGIISKIDYNNNNLTFEENKYNNSVQGKMAEMAFYDFLKSKNIATEKDWNDMLTVLDTNYDFGDFRLPNNKIIDIKSYTYLDNKYKSFPFSEYNLRKDMDYFVFSVVNGVKKKKEDKKDFNKNEYTVDFYGFIDKYKIKSLINEGKIKIGHNKKGDEFCLIPCELLRPIGEIYLS